MGKPARRLLRKPKTSTCFCVYIFTVSRHVPRAGLAAFRLDGSNRTHCRKHGVSIAEIEALLRSNPRVAPDLRHAHLEDRLIAVGRTAQGRPLFVAFVLRRKFGQPTIRPVSARYMHAKEVERYEAQGPENDH
jgi:uncharacterized DUF497 family protein